MNYIYGNTGEYTSSYIKSSQPLWFIAKVVDGHYEIVQWFMESEGARTAFNFYNEKEELEVLRKENAELREQVKRIKPLTTKEALEICKSWQMTDKECEDLMT